MSFFDDTINNNLLLAVGDIWTATLGGQTSQFYGIFDAENRLETDGTGQPVLITGSVVTCLASVSRTFIPNDTILTSPQGTEWSVREVLKVDDGQLSRVSVVEVE